MLARLDDALYRARLDQAHGRVAKAEADIEQAEAKLRQADREMDRARKLKAAQRGPRRPAAIRRLPDRL